MVSFAGVLVGKIRSVKSARPLAMIYHDLICVPLTHQWEKNIYELIIL